MRAWRPIALLAALAAPASPAAAGAAQPAEAAQRDWTEIVEATPEGGFRMGNPAARVKLVEYASITCSHCATFSVAAAETLRNDYIRGGQVSWEIRPFLIFPSDPGVFMLLACRGAPDYFKLTERLHAANETWTARLAALPDAQVQVLEVLAPLDQARAIVQITEVDQVLRQSGMSQAEIDRCLADQSALDRLAEVTREGNTQHGVQGTPTFFIDGNRLDVSDWPSLQPQLAAALE